MEAEAGLVRVAAAEARVQGPAELAAGEPAVAEARVAEAAEEEQDLAGPAVAEEWADRAEEAAPAVDLASADLVVVEERNRENG